MRIRESLETAKLLVIEKGYIPKFNEYIGSNVPMPVKCPEHGSFMITVKALKRGTGCRDCGYEKLSKTFSGTLEQARERFIAAGLEPLFTEYSSGKMLGRCRIHGDVQLTYAAVATRGCPDCGHIAGGEKIRTDFNEIKQMFEGSGFELLSKNYESHSDLIHLKCPKHGIMQKTLKRIKKGGFCTSCSHVELNKNRKLLKEKAK